MRTLRTLVSSLSAAALLLGTSAAYAQTAPDATPTPTPAAQAAPAASAPAPAPAPAAAPASAKAPQTIKELEALSKLDKLDHLDQAELAKPEQLKFFEVNGYFRVRADLFNQLDLGVYDHLRPYTDKFNDPTVKGINSNVRGNSNDSLITGANMRFRLSPTLNVSEQIRIKSDFDILDNVVLGSTPDTYYRTGTGKAGITAAGLAAQSANQVSPSASQNSYADAIRVKHVWAEVQTPVGQLSFGRMPENWGLGMFLNDGHGIDDDYGDTVDRIRFDTSVFEHRLFLSLDFANQGITNATSSMYVGQPKDASDLDDVHQMSFGFVRKHSAAEAEERVENNGVVVDYGFNNVVRWQKYALENNVTGAMTTPGVSYSEGDTSSVDAARQGLVKRNLKMWTGDIWLKLLYKHLHLEFESALVAGSIGNGATTAADMAKEQKIDLLQYAMVLKADYRFLEETLFVGLEWGLASGDPYPGFGTDPYNNKQYGTYQRTRDSKIIRDYSINNFRFNPDYHVDLLLFREILGQITDATYIKPSVMYNITPSIGVRLDGIVSMAMEPDSTPSYNHMKFDSYEDAKKYNQVDPASNEKVTTPDPETQGDSITVTKRKTSRYLGTELDFSLFYKSFDGWGIQLQYGILFPGQAFGRWNFDRVVDSVARPSWMGVGNIAQTAQCNMWVEF